MSTFSPDVARLRASSERLVKAICGRIEIQGYDPHPPFLSAVRTYFAALPAPFSTFVNIYAPKACRIAALAYADCDPQRRWIVAVYTLFIFYVDDRIGSGDVDSEDAREFGRRFAGGGGGGEGEGGRGEGGGGGGFEDPVLRLLRTFLSSDVVAECGMLVANELLIGVLRMLNGARLEGLDRRCRSRPSTTATAKTNSNSRELKAGAGAGGHDFEGGAFARWLRRRTSVEEAFAFLLFRSDADVWRLSRQLPALCRLVAGVNDVLSAYKEACGDAETEGFLFEDARVRGEALEASVERECALLVRLWEEIRERDEDGRLGGYLSGYVRFHLEEPRYRLKELLGV